MMYSDLGTSQNTEVDNNDSNLNEYEKYIEENTVRTAGPCPFCGNTLVIITSPWSDGTPCYEIDHKNPKAGVDAKCPMVMSGYDTIEEAFNASEIKVHNMYLDKWGNRLSVGDIISTKDENFKFVPYVIIELNSDPLLPDHVLVQPLNEPEDTPHKFLVHPSNFEKIGEENG